MKINIQPNTTVALGFSVSILLIFIIIYFWFYSEQTNKRQAEDIVNAQHQTRNLQKMLHAAHQRAISLYKMLSLDDIFERDEEYQFFLRYGKKLDASLQAISSSEFTANENKVWEQILNTLDKDSLIQKQVIDLMEQERNSAAYDILANDLSNNQKMLMDKLTIVINSEEKTLALKLKNEARENTYIYILIILLGVLGMVIGILTFIVTKRTAQAESALISQAERIRSLYEVSSITGLSLSSQIHETLKVGCRLFNLEIGKLCKINISDNTNTFIDVVAPDSSSIKSGMVVPLEKTFCSIPYSNNIITMIENISSSEYKKYPCADFTNLGSYIATVITVNGEKYGTINFSSFREKTSPYSQTDKDLLHLIGRWVGVALERQLSEKYQVEKKAAQDADSAKSLFLASMSHEFRTPLNAILGYSELLIDICKDTGDALINSDLKKINTAGKHLLSLVNDVLDLSKIESGKMEVLIENFSIEPVISSVIDTAKPLVEINNNILNLTHAQCDYNMFSDKIKLQQILLNLVSNATKFTENGTITLRILERDIDGVDFMEFVVSDTGIGMTNDQITIIFDEFIQADNTITSRFGGTGLGLSICKKFSHMLGGNIKVTSLKGKGSEFSLILPKNYNNVTTEEQSVVM